MEWPAAARESAADWELRAHLGGCARCREFASLRAWSGDVVRMGALAAPPPPPMAAIWAAIRRGSRDAWEGALTRGFRQLVPYLASITALFVLAGALALRSPAPAEADGSPTAQALLVPGAAAAPAPESAPQSADQVLGFAAR